MDAFNKRAFARTHYETPVIYAYSNSDVFHDAKMLNTSLGGMYIETIHSLIPGSEIYIKAMDFSSASYWREEGNDFSGVVAWCRELMGNEMNDYGIGVRFLLNVCDQCGDKIPCKSIQKIDNYIHLCPDCSMQLDMLPDISRTSIESYLLGNVI